LGKKDTKVCSLLCSSALLSHNAADWRLFWKFYTRRSLLLVAATKSFLFIFRLLRRAHYNKLLPIKMLSGAQ